jgi:phosphopentomutase
VIGNIPASGTEIIKKLGEEHIRTKSPIVYTSADSVFQIACHVGVYNLSELYGFCETARAMLTGEHSVARVIARPFAGAAPDFYRTKDRRDFSVPPPESTLLDLAKSKGYEVIAIGKIDNLFAERGYTRSYHSVSNQECVKYVLEAMTEPDNRFIIANFVQFDMDWGHRNDVPAFARGLTEIDAGLGAVIGAMGTEDLLFITADHGNDPTTPSTDHSREYVPILVYPASALPVGRGNVNNGTGKDLGVRNSFADLAQTIAVYLDIEGVRNGENFGQTV